MKVTDEMVRAFTAAIWANPDGLIELDEDERRAGIQAVLDLIETHDEETLMKVRTALFHVLGGQIDQQIFTDLISEMQNAGILFREAGQ